MKTTKRPAPAVMLAWHPRHLDEAAGGSAHALPLTPATLAHAQALGLPLPDDPVATMDLRRPAQDLRRGALRLTEAALAGLAAQRPEAGSILHEPALDRWQLYGWARQILHLRDILTPVLASAPGGLRVPDAAADTAGHEARMRWFVALALAALGGDGTVPRPALYRPPAAEGSHDASPSQEAGTIVVATFGITDLPSLIKKLAGRREHLVLVCESEHSHLEYLGKRWGELRLRPGGASLIVPEGAPHGAEGEIPCSGSTQMHLAAAIRSLAWPRRVQAEAAVRKVFSGHHVREVHISDHASDTGYASLIGARDAGAPLVVHGHSGLGLPHPFDMPLEGAGAGEVVIPTKVRARTLLKTLETAGVGLRVTLNEPVSLRRQLVKGALLPMRRLLKPSRGFRVGVLVTTGLDCFAPETSLRALIDDFGALVEGGVPLDMDFAVRLRQFEDDPALFLPRLSTAGAARVTFHRVGDKPLAGVLGQLDALIELGGATSASIKAIARGVPVFRLRPVEREALLRGAPRLMVLPLAGAASALQKLLANPRRRSRELIRLQRSLSG